MFFVAQCPIFKHYINIFMGQKSSNISPSPHFVLVKELGHVVSVNLSPLPSLAKCGNLFWERGERSLREIFPTPAREAAGDNFPFSPRLAKCY